MCSNVYLRTYLKNGKAAEKVKTHIKIHLNRRISEHLIEHVNLTITRVKNLANRLEEANMSTKSNETANIFRLKMLAVMQAASSLTIKGTKVDGLQLIEERKQRSWSELRQLLKEQIKMEGQPKTVSICEIDRLFRAEL